MSYGFLSGSATASLSWKIVPQGAGGFNTGASIGFDGTNQYIYVRCDVFGGYRWDPAATSPIGTTGSWTCVYRADTMPSDYAEGSDNIGYNGCLGCYEMQCCYGTPSVVYAMFPDVNNTVPQTSNSTIFKSTNYGNNWSRTSFTPIASSSAPPNDTNYKTMGPKIGVDPNNSNNVLVGTQGAGLFRSTDGNTFSAISTGSVPAGSGAGYTGIKFNSANSLQVYVCSWGNGVYHSTDGGSTWALTASGGPTQVAWADIDPNTGHYWCTDASGGVWVFNGTAWSNPITLSATPAIGIDYTTANHIFLLATPTFPYVNSVYETTNGTSFTESANSTSATGDIGWIANAATGYANGNAGFLDRVTGDKFWTFGNLGPFYATWSGTITNSTPVSVTFQGRGIEEMVGISVLAPLGGNPICAFWDNGVSPFNANAYPSVRRPFSTSGTQMAAWGMDNAVAGGSPNFLVLIGDGDYESGTNQDATSSDYGQTWTSIKATMPFANSGGACVAVSTTTNFMFSDLGTRQPYYTQDGGSTWAAASFPGVASWTNFGGVNSGTGVWINADRVTTGNFAAFFSGVGFFITTNKGVTWTGPFNATLANTFLVPGRAIFKSVPGNAGYAVISNAEVGVIGGGVQWNGGSGNYFGYTQNLYAGSSCTFTQFGNVGVARAFGFGAGNAVAYAGWSSYAFASSIPIQTGSGTLSITGSPAYTLLPGSALVLANGSSLLRGTVTSYVGGVLTYNIDHVLGGSGTMAGGFVQVQGIFSATGLSANPVWQQIASFAANSLDQVKSVDGDPNIAGRWYVTYSGSGAKYLG